jgi:hypothetical protein
MTKASWFLAVTCALGCGSSSSTKTDAPNQITDGKPSDGTVKMDAPAHVVMDAPAGTFPLTVKNYDLWCSVSVNGGTFSTNVQQLVNVLPGTIQLAAKPASAMFELGPAPWHDTDGDTGSGELGTVSNGTSSTTITVGSAAKCVWVCCPFTSGTGCPTADQCS